MEIAFDMLRLLTHSEFLDYSCSLHFIGEIDHTFPLHSSYVVIEVPSLLKYYHSH